MLSKIEVRVNDITHAQQYSKYNIAEIGIGNEGCLLKIPSFEEIKNLVNMLNKKVKLVLPFVPQIHISKIKDLLFNISKEQLEMILVVNDLGILSYLQTLDTSNLTIIAGRFLDWSYSLIPWGENILRNENSEVHLYAMQSSLLDDKKLGLFRNMKVAGIELNATKQNIEMSSKFKQCGLELYLHCKYNLLSTSRACAFKRMTNHVKCTSQCNELHEINISEKWIPNSSFSQNKKSFVEDTDIKNYFPKLFLKNNMVFWESGHEISNLLKHEDFSIIVSEDILDETGNLDFFREKSYESRI